MPGSLPLARKKQGMWFVLLVGRDASQGVPGVVTATAATTGKTLAAAAIAVTMTAAMIVIMTAAATVTTVVGVFLGNLRSNAKVSFSFRRYFGGILGYFFGGGWRVFGGAFRRFLGVI